MARILVVDDDEQVRKLYRSVLERAEHEVIEAANGDEGIRCYRKTKVDVVITDLIMPDKEGLEMIRELTLADADVKIIAISGGGRITPDSYLKVAKSLGARHIFTKPVSYKQLIGAISDLVGVP